MAKPLVAIVGRPNVGKSMLFNKLTGRRTAIVEDTPGVTRDRLYGECDWNGRDFELVDTGGIEPKTDSHMLKFMRRQAEIAIDTADVIVMVCDIKTGPTAADHEIANMLLRSKKPVVLAVNKCDNTGPVNPDIYEFYSLGLGDPIPVSAFHGHGTGDLLDLCVENFPPETEEEQQEDVIKVAIVGKPNVGKSSLLNYILGEERVIVSNVAGTTRDAIDSYYENEYGKYVFIDTAGMRKKSKVDDSVEKFSNMRSIDAISRADVCLILVDANEGVTEQDQKIAGLAIERGCALIILLNKWDLVTDDHAREEVMQSVARRMTFAPWAPVIRVSALTGRSLEKVWAVVDRVGAAHSGQVSTSALNNLLAQMRESGHTIVKGPKRLRIQYANQTGNCPPALTFFCNFPELVDDNFKRYLENRLREQFNLEGTPLRLRFRKKQSA